MHLDPARRTYITPGGSELTEQEIARKGLRVRDLKFGDAKPVTCIVEPANDRLLVATANVPKLLTRFTLDGVEYLVRETYVIKGDEISTVFIQPVPPKLAEARKSESTEDGG